MPRERKRVSTDRPGRTEARRSAEQGVDLPVGRETPGAEFGIGGPAVDDDLEGAGRAGRDLDILGAERLEPVPRTEGARLVVSP